MIQLGQEWADYLTGGSTEAWRRKSISEINEMFIENEATKSYKKNLSLKTHNI